MVTMKKRNNGWMVDYYLNGKRTRLQINDTRKAKNLVQELSKKISTIKDDINSRKLLDTA
jgi:hypothetical protein